MISAYKKLTVAPYTQWEPEVEAPASACGPATMAALAEYWSTQRGCSFIQGESYFHSKAAHMNYIYGNHGGTPWGMSVGGFKKGIRAYIDVLSMAEKGSRYKLSLSTFNDFDRYKAEIDADRPVAIKFDKWFSFHWKGSYAYDYHWVIGIGYEESDEGQSLIIMDNGVKITGGDYIPSSERRINYGINKKILTMIALNIENM